MDFLETLFIGSDEIKKWLLKKTEEFQEINQEVKEILKSIEDIKNIHKFAN